MKLRSHEPYLDTAKYQFRARQSRRESNSPSKSDKLHVSNLNYSSTYSPSSVFGFLRSFFERSETSREAKLVNCPSVEEIIMQDASDRLHEKVDQTLHRCRLLDMITNQYLKRLNAPDFMVGILFSYKPEFLNNGVHCLWTMQDYDG